MDEEEIRSFEKEIETEKQEREKERIRIKRILNIAQKLKKPNFLNLACPECGKRLKVIKFEKWDDEEYEDLFLFQCDTCWYEYAKIDEHYPNMYCEPLH